MSTINKTYPVTIAVGGSQLLESGGRYVYCIEADQASFDISIDDVQQGICGPGLGYELDIDSEPFGKVRIVNTGGAVLNATIVIGGGRVLDNRLTLTGIIQMQGVVGGVPVQVQGPAGPGDPVPVDFEPSALGGNNAGGTATVAGAGGVVTLVTPAANVNGIELLHAVLRVDSGTGGGIVAHTAAPADDYSLGYPILHAPLDTGLVLPRPLIIPAGQGIYIVKQGGTNAVFARINYNLL